MNTDLMTRAVAKLGTIQAVADYLEVTHGCASQWVNGTRPLPPFHAAQLSTLLGERWYDGALPALVAKAKTKKEKDFWLGKLSTLAKIAAQGVTAISLAMILLLGVFGNDRNSPEPAFL